eukprot:CAMPEP_0171385218 /NCGR_PEP_ID=MMETSP0879-20121228/38874_1 /TAXON_ID=67004 /ORGANISM="Thalassiosira weissflogii, Strain CCMP1336" /LENGTH=308 /DNA_ID=CAMNT_0011897515 /DNA_START=240 /DNA_END=1163 /DNA_ORIENTATION=+
MSSSTKSRKNTKPLSAYNLFFQYNRIKLLASLDNDGLSNLAEPDSAPLPGLEHVDSNACLLATSQPEIRRYRKQVIEGTIDNSPFNDPGMKAGHGSMTFLEMSNYMSKKWKFSDEITKSIFRQISNELEMSNYMSKKWKFSDEITKSIFRQISNERKAKHQKLQFDLYKKSAERFSLTAKSAAMAKLVSKPKNIDNNVFRTVSTDFRPTPRSKNGSAKSSPFTRSNAEWEEQFPDDVAEIGNPKYFCVSTSPDFNNIDARTMKSNEETAKTSHSRNSVNVGLIHSSVPPRFAPDSVDGPLPFLGNTEK